MVKYTLPSGLGPPAIGVKHLPARKLHHSPARPIEVCRAWFADIWSHSIPNELGVYVLLCGLCPLAIGGRYVPARQLHCLPALPIDLRRTCVASVR